MSIEINNNKLLRLILLSLFATILTIFLYRESLILLFFREYKIDGQLLKRTTEIDNSALNLIISFLVRPIPLIVLIFFKLLKFKNKFVEVFLWILGLISNFPLALARFYIAGLYLPIFFIYFHKQIFKPFIVPLGLIFSILLIFPFLNQGRTITSIEDFKFGLNIEMFMQGHFDSYQNFARVIQFNTITYGKQLIGVLLFFIPRSIYPEKPIGSGGFIAEKYGLDFDHISMNYFGEGYLNFGFLGIVIFVIMIAYLNAKFDKLSDNQQYFNNPLFKTIYYIYLGMMIFNLRGDLISSVAFSIGLFLCTNIIFKLIK
jgi:oligosaccharide repeat unit polymerase